LNFAAEFTKNIGQTISSKAEEGGSGDDD